MDGQEMCFRNERHCIHYTYLLRNLFVVQRCQTGNRRYQKNVVQMFRRKSEYVTSANDIYFFSTIRIKAMKKFEISSQRFAAIMYKILKYSNSMDFLWTRWSGGDSASSWEDVVGDITRFYVRSKTLCAVTTISMTPKTSRMSCKIFQDCNRMSML